MNALFLSANNGLHFAWYDTQYVSAGTIKDHMAKRPPYPFTIVPLKGKTLGVHDLFGISSNDDMHFAWYMEPDSKKLDSFKYFWVCAGPSNALGTKRDWYSSALPKGAHRDNLLFITSNNHMHFAWFRKGEELWVGRGVSDNLGKHDIQHCLLPPDVKIGHILYLASDDRQHYAFLRNGLYLTGSSDRLERPRGGSIYDLVELGDFLKV
ncbi:MAG: hypothetical protein IPL49_21125 [Saprospirales bacterium]|nr:hypothetical protein [Saprospirales bacterium]